MENKLKYVFVPMYGDREKIMERLAHYKTCNKQQLVDRYNEACTLGIVGSRAQAVDLVALRFMFIELFKASPISVEDNCIIGFSGKIVLLDHSFVYLEKHLN